MDWLIALTPTLSHPGEGASLRRTSTTRPNSRKYSLSRMGEGKGEGDSMELCVDAFSDRPSLSMPVAPGAG